MAVKTRTIRIMYENNGTFQMATRLDDGEWYTVTEIDENDYFSDLWESGVKPLCKEYFDNEIDNIGAEMKG